MQPCTVSSLITDDLDRQGEPFLMPSRLHAGPLFKADFSMPRQPAKCCLKHVTNLPGRCRKRLAIVTTDKVIYLLDENGERQDKFKAKANAEAAQPDFIVRAMAYSPDSMRLAIAQSDNMVFVYKLGLEWGEKKSISSKLAMQVRPALPRQLCRIHTAKDK